MLKRKIKALEAEKKLREIDLMILHDTPCDPMQAELEKSNIMVDIMHIESEIEFEKVMLPFKYTIAVFIVASIAMLVYASLK